MSHATQLHNRRYFDDYMEIINRKGLPGNVKSELCEQVNRAVVATTQSVIEQALEEEVTLYLGAERYEHLPWGRGPEQTRSGYYPRELITQYGRIADVRVPKLRKGNGDLEGQTLSRYERCWGPFLDQQVMNYGLGLSLRDLQESMHATLGEVLSLASCNRIVASTEEEDGTIDYWLSFNDRPLVLESYSGAYLRHLDADSWVLPKAFDGLDRENFVVTWIA